MSPTFLNRVSELARAPQGRRVADDVLRRARDPQARRQLDRVRARLTDRGPEAERRVGRER